MERARGPLIRIKRVYEDRGARDGERVLVERLWPRGVRKEALAADRWEKDAAPSAELRRWFGHRADRWDEFRRRYRAELDAHTEGWRALLDESRKRTLTLLYSAHDAEHNSAVVLRDYLAERAPKPRAARQRRTNL